MAHRLGLCDATLAVHMPGGQLTIELLAEQQLRMCGPVVCVAMGQIMPEIFSEQ